MKPGALCIFLMACFFFPRQSCGQSQAGMIAPRQVEDSMVENYHLNKKLEYRRQRIRDSISFQMQPGPWIILVPDTLYTWTTEKQVEELRRNKTLLTKSKSDAKGASLYDQCLEDTSLKKDPLIALLGKPQFSKKRFAWTDGWPTVMGWHKEKYGRQLIQIVLSDSSIIGHLDETKRKGYYNYSLIFFDFKGHKLTGAYVIKNQDKIAAVYHTSNQRKNRKKRKRSRSGTFRPHGRAYTIPYFKEYVIVNEKMVANWSYGTENIKSKLRSEIQLISLLEQAVSHPDILPTPEQANAKNQYGAKTCFFNAYYTLKQKQLEDISKELERAVTEQSEPFSK